MYMTAEQYEMLHDARKRVPRYLFRTISPSSRGSNSRSASTNAPHTHPDDDDQSRTRRMLEDHLTWARTSDPSEFTSWTSSLLCALRHAMRKRYCRAEPESAVRVAVLDTSNFALPVWPAVALYDAYGVEPRVVPGKRWKELERHYYLDEYLVRGGVRAGGAGTRFCVASLRELREVGGLHELLPELFETGERRARRGLARAIRDDRDALLYAAGGKALTRREMELARRLGECFAAEEGGGGGGGGGQPGGGGAFVFPVAVAFLALRRWDVLFAPGRDHAKTELEDGILDELRDFEIPDGLGGQEDFSDVGEPLRRYKPEEAILFGELFQQLVARSRGERYDDLIGGLLELHVESSPQADRGVNPIFPPQG